ncbi:probable plastidic glucose transporter 1 isoform X2 [Macadamia integrifolia]|uniref:probable plastidic glucose transporter 1 isoform X2 n=1 Tax=Macadamia integrifolia TaxID=60698 RepID=UPI001C4F7440|nr:probable plastidic glucose transporter 1 isoform X2 [Macadamia integrifolia]
MISQSSGWSTNLPSVPMRIAAIQASPSLPTITISRFIYKPKYFRRPLVAKLPFRLRFPSSWRKLEVPAVPATKRQPSQLEESQKSTESEIALLSEKGDGGPGYGWLPAFPHVLLASMANVIFGYHIGAQAHSLDEMLWGRFLVGLGIGVNTALVPIYISEVSPTRYRGSLGTLCQIGTCIGIIASLFLGIPSESDPHWWRTMLYIASLPAFILTFGMQFAVDSPRWLCKVGRLDDAKTVIRNLWGKSEVDKSIEEFQSVIRNDGSDLESSWLELLEEPHRRVAFIGGALFVLQQFAGINGVLYFSSLTFHDVGITSSGLASLLVGFTNFGGALLALYLMDKQGRKKLLIGSYLGMAASMFLIVYAISSPLDEQLAHNLSILGTLVYIFTFAVGAGPVTGLIIPELSSTRTRGKIMGFSLCVHWVCNFLVGLYFLKLVDRFGVSPVYASFGGVSLLSAIFASYFIVETKGHSLEEIEMLLKLPDTRK